jgi:hypothetical protein
LNLLTDVRQGLHATSIAQSPRRGRWRK